MDREQLKMSAVVHSRAFILAGLLALVGCGGGGGGASTNDEKRDGLGSNSTAGCASAGATCPLILTPSALNDQVEEGISSTLDVAFSSTLSSPPQYVRVSDPSGIFEPVITLNWYSSSTGVARLKSRAPAKAGNYKSSLKIELCDDGACATQVAGSPVFLPYEITVQSAAPNLTPLAQVTSDWQSFQGNFAHTGSVSLTVNPENFSHRWHWVPPSDSGINSVSHVVSSNGAVFFSTKAGRGGGPVGNWLVALDESTGQQKWVHDFGYSDATIPPAVHEGVVYAGHKLYGGGSDQYTGLRANDGHEVWGKYVPAQWRYPRAPIVAGGRLIQHGGYNNGGIVGLSLDGPSTDWFANLWDDSYPGAVTTDGDFAYALMFDNTYEAEGYLAIVDVQTGSLAKHVRPTWPPGTHPFGISTYVSGTPTPVLVGPNKILLAYTFGQTSKQYHLELINTSNSTDVWHLDIPFETDMTCMYLEQCNLEPVVANGVIYVLNPASKALEARRLSDGGKMWSWKPPEADRSPIFDSERPSIVSTSNMVFVSTTRFVYAINLATGASAWRRLGSGQLAISGSSVLYISRPTGRVDAVNLR